MSTSPPEPAGALRIGRVAGVPVFLDRTWLLLAAFFAYTGFQSGRSEGTAVAVAYAVWMVVTIFTAVIGHEVGHALTARAFGFRVHQVVATLWGGHTSYDATGSTPGRSALVALSGPAVNVALSVAGFAVACLLGRPRLWFAWYFGFLNALLGGFNLLPGLPLDGGAAVQSLVWAVTGRRDRGLLVAGWIGRLVAVALVVGFAGVPLLRSGTPDLFERPHRPRHGLDPLERRDRRHPPGGVRARPRHRARRRRGRAGRRPPGEHAARGGPDQPRPRRQPRRALRAQPRPAGVPPTIPDTTAVGAVVTRVPDENVVEVAPEAGIGAVLRAMSATGVGVVVVTRGGEAWGLVGAAAVDAAAKRARTRT